jgi:hypothetical protein
METIRIESLQEATADTCCHPFGQRLQGHFDCLTRPIGEVFHPSLPFGLTIPHIFAANSRVRVPSRRAGTEYEYEYEKKTATIVLVLVLSPQDGNRARIHACQDANAERLDLCGTASPLGRVKRRNAVFLLLRMLDGVAVRGFPKTIPPYLRLTPCGS